MFKKDLIKKYRFPLLVILTSIMFLIFLNPFSKLAKEPDNGTTTYSNNELKEYHEKYNGLLISIRYDLSNQGYPLSVDFALSDNEKIEILIKSFENDKNLTTNKIQEVEQLTKQFIEKHNFDPSNFKISVSNTPLKTTNRLSYNDLMDYLLNALTVQNISGFNMNYKIMPETSEITLQFSSPLDKKEKEKIHQIVNKVLEKNNFDPSSVQIKIKNFFNKTENLSPQKQDEVDNLYEELQKENGFIEQVGQELIEAGYMDSISGTIYYSNEIELFFDYPDDKAKQEEIRSIIEEYITKFELNADTFHIKFNVNELNDF